MTQILICCRNPLVACSGIEAVDDWPKIQLDDHLKLGQVSGVAVDSNNHVHVFHRGTRVWNARSELSYTAIHTHIFCLFCIYLYSVADDSVYQFLLIILFFIYCSFLVLQQEPGPPYHRPSGVLLHWLSFAENSRLFCLGRHSLWTDYWHVILTNVLAIMWFCDIVWLTL